MRAKAGANRLCKGCGLPFVKKGRSYHPGCRPISGHVVVHACIDCGKVRKVWSPRPRLRCKACEFKSRRGAGNSNWKGGLKSEGAALRASPEYKAWRLSVFERDNYTCVSCGRRGGDLHADHIEPFSTHVSLRLELSNGRTLCVECHKKTPSYLNGAITLRNELLRSLQQQCSELISTDPDFVAIPNRLAQGCKGIVASVAPLGRFVSFELSVTAPWKTQRVFQDIISTHGGLTFIINSVDCMKKAMKRAKNGESE